MTMRPWAAAARTVGVVIGVFWLAGCAQGGTRGYWRSGEVVGEGQAGADWARKYVREIALPPAAEGESCVALVPEVYTHAATAAMNELVVFAESPGTERRSVPFTLTESGTVHGPPDVAQVTGVRFIGGKVSFSLVMPKRAYSAVDLALGGTDFVGTATVTGLNAQGEAMWLGTHVVFDETGAGLGRSTRMELAEESFPVLQIKLRLQDLRGQAWRGKMAVGSASVPQSREAQTVYVPVAQAAEGIASASNAFLVVAPAHVPVERVVVDVGGEENFLREVTIAAGEDVVQGSVTRVRLRNADGHTVVYERRDVPAVLAANLRDAAEVRVQVQGALPLHTVTLAMRQRKVCFVAERDVRYELAYGGEHVEFEPAVRKAAGVTQLSSVIAEGTVGPERENAKYVLPGAWQVWWKRQPELLWVAALGLVALLAAQMQLRLKRKGWR